jgi:hypothetical protein
MTQRLFFLLKLFIFFAHLFNPCLSRRH